MAVQIDLSDIFTRKNIEILQLLDKETGHLRDIAEKLQISPAKVHNTLQLFKKHDLIIENRVKNKVIIKLNKKNQLLKKINELIKVTGAGGIEEDNEEVMGLFDSISPLDFRYYGRNKEVMQALQPYLSETGFIKYMAKVEAALTTVLARRGVCSVEVAKEVAKACLKVTPEEVYAEEDRIKHNVRALANVIRSKVSDKAKPYVHFTTTSHDIICSADAARLKDFNNYVLLPKLRGFIATLVKLAKREKMTLQIGRTHGQHAEPITFGFTIANYISRLGNRFVKLKQTGDNLRGKIAGAVGAYNASALFFKNPKEFETEVLRELGVMPSPASTQVVAAEYMADYVHAVVSAFGVLANIADDMRHLQRSEIGEVGEPFGDKQVGSSTMPQKRNPINFENVKAMWKEFMPRMATLYMDQISEHQRDLTNSATSRFIPEILAGFYVSIDRLDRIMSKIVVDKENLAKNFEMNKEMITAEPIYILLAAQNHPDAHEAVREFTLKSQKTKKPLRELIFHAEELKPYLKKLHPNQIEILKHPEKYIGLAASKTDEICGHWAKELKLGKGY